MDSAETYCFILTALDSIEQSQDLARYLVEVRLAACVSILPQGTSVYRWKGSLEETNEWILLIKTQTSKVAALEKVLQEKHPYEVPEIVQIPWVAASGRYLDWMNDVL